MLIRAWSDQSNHAMAEIIGATASVITLASLFKGCIDAFDLFKCAKNQDIDLRKLNLKLSIERCRLLVWGKSMGLSDDTDSSQNVLNDCDFHNIIHDTLQIIVQLFTDSQALAGKYGCRVLEISDAELGLLEWESSSPTSRLNAAFNKFKSSVQATGSRAKRTTRWVIQDRKKFGLLIKEARELIDGLQDITK